jgi:hypothetical protein
MGFLMNRMFVVSISIFLSQYVLAKDGTTASLTTKSLLDSNNVNITLGYSVQIFHLDSADAMGMKNVPDQHTCVVRLPDSSYQVYITGVIGEGSVALLTTKDFMNFAPVVGNSKRALPVFGSSCPGNPEPDSCARRYDSDYAGANLVWTASNGKDLLMLYVAGNKSIENWEVLAMARSIDDGHSWIRIGPVISSADPMPTSNIKTTSILGVVEPGAIIAKGFIYAYYAYFPNPNAADSGKPTIQVARAPLSGDGAPGTWTKYYNGSFDSEPGLGGRGSQVVPDIPGNSRSAQPWPAFSTYLNAYILLFIAQDGWFYSTSNDLVTWSQPVLFYHIKTFQDCQPNDDNFVFVTPGNPGQVIGQTGIVLYSHTPRFGFGTCPTVQFHELWIRPFTFSTVVTNVHQIDNTVPQNYKLEQNFPNPFNPSTTIRYNLPIQSKVILIVFNILGQKVRSLVQEVQEAGYHEVKLDGLNLSGGVYFYRIMAGTYVETKKLILLK